MRTQTGIPNNMNRPGMNNPSWNYQNANMTPNNQYPTSNPGGIRPILRQNLDNKGPGRGMTPFPPGVRNWGPAMPPRQHMNQVIKLLRNTNYVISIRLYLLRNIYCAENH